METCAKCGAALGPDGSPGRHRESDALGPLADVGRIFYGVGEEACLCTRCRREVEHAGGALIQDNG